MANVTVATGLVDTATPLTSDNVVDMDWVKLVHGKSG